LLDGFAARFKTLSTGVRQITGIHVPGDFLDLHGFLLKTLAYGVVALSDCKVVQLDHENLRKITATSPHLARLLWTDTLIDASITREWLASMGRRSAEGHLAHLICELFTRLEVVQQTSSYSFRVPLKQADLADILGLSVVHVNRTLQSLRKQGLIIWEGMRVHIENWDGLVKIAEFDPTYLCLQSEPR
jgi:CRP-like cAMP-binding protein